MNNAPGLHIEANIMAGQPTPPNIPPWEIRV